MSNVGTGTSGYPLTGTGTTSQPTYSAIGTNSSLTTRGVVIAEGTGAFQATAAGTAGQVLQSGGASANPSYSTSKFPTTSGAEGKILISDGTNIVFSTPTYPNTSGGSGQILRSDGSNIGFTTASYPTTTTVSQILYSSAANTISGLATANNSVVLTGATGIPALGTSLTNDFTYTSSTAAATRTLTVSNTDNTSGSSTALIQTTTGGASSGDALHTFTVTGATSWSQGIDNSASDAFVTSASTALGTTNVMSLATGGAASFVLGNLDVTKSSNAADVSITSSNTSNTASSTSSYYAIVAGSTAGDAVYQASVSGTTQWTWGIDNSVTSPTADPFVIAQGTALGTNNIMSVATSGEINFPLQSAFLAYQASQASNVTGDGTGYVLGTTVDLTEIFDQNSDFDPTSGVFTAPVTGRYYLSMAALVLGATAITNCDTKIISSNRNYRRRLTQGAACAITGLTTSIDVLADMDAADTATAYIETTDTGGKIDDVYGDGDSWTYFSGNLEC